MDIDAWRPRRLSRRRSHRTLDSIFVNGFRQKSRASLTCRGPPATRTLASCDSGSSGTVACSKWHRLWSSSAVWPSYKRRMDLVFLRILLWPLDPFSIDSIENRPVASKASARIGSAPTLVMSSDTRSNKSVGATGRNFCKKGGKGDDPSKALSFYLSPSFPTSPLDAAKCEQQ